MNYKAGLARQFDRGSSTYDRFAQVQVDMGARLLATLSQFPGEISEVLELGCGTGALTANLAAAYPAARITAVDIAPGMVNIARRRRGTEGVEFIEADAELLEYRPGSFDIIISNATIQWFERVECSMKNLVQALRPGGLMLHSTFGPRTFEELDEILDEMGRTAKRGLDLPSPECWKDIMGAAGIDGATCLGSTELHYYPGLVSFLKSLKGIGASFAPYLHPDERSRYRILRELIDRYDKRFWCPEGVRVTYELLEIAGTRNNAATQSVRGS